MTIRVRAVVTGRVQGVGFRWTTAHGAARHGVAGFVRNLPDGRVEAELEGARDAVDAVLQVLRAGPPAATVTGVEVEDLPPRGDTRFDVRG